MTAFIDLLPVIITSFTAGALGSLLLWRIFGPYIIDKGFEKGFVDLTSGKYDEIIEEVSVRAVGGILKSPTLKKTIGTTIQNYAGSMSKQVIAGFSDQIKSQYGIDVSQAAQNFQGGGGMNPDAIIEKLLGKLIG